MRVERYRAQPWHRGRRRIFSTPHWSIAALALWGAIYLFGHFVACAI